MHRLLAILAKVAGASLILGLAACASSPPTDLSTVREDARGKYTISVIPKVEGRYFRVDGDAVRIPPTGFYRIAFEDDKSFYVKMYVPVAQPVIAGPLNPLKLAPAPAATARLAFAEVDAGLPRRGQWREAFAIADMNGDGRPDIVTAPARKTLGPPVIFLNDGRGRFARWSQARFPELPYDYGSVAVADFNGDGNPDIALAAHLVGVGVLLGDGKGNFTAFNQGLPAMKAGERTPESFSGKSIRALDWDGDGRVDLVVQQEPGGGKALTSRPDSLVVFLNKGDRWQVLDNGSGEVLPGDQLSIADLDGDGRPDAILGSSILGYKRIVRLNRGRTTEVLELPALPDATSIAATAAGDVTGDGKADIVVALAAWNGAQWISGIDVLVNDGGGRFTAKPLWREATRDSVSALAIVDLDRDGKPDIVALRQNGGLLSFVADGKGFFTRDASLPTPAWRSGCTGIDIKPIAMDTGVTLVASFSGEGSAMEIPPRCRNEGGITLIAVTPAG